MARFTADQADHYGGQGGGGFLQLRNDGDVAQVRFMYNTIGDVEGLSVHTLEKVVDGKKKKMYVNCLREYNQPVADCPFCAAGMFTQAKLFIPIYDEQSGTTKTWERGKKFFGKISSLCSRYSGKDQPLVSHTFEIERNGEAGDQTTTYEVYETGQDDTTLEDLPEVPSLDRLVLNKTAEEMEYYLQEGQFPPTEDDEQEDEEERPVRRRSASNSNEGRRTPAANNRGRRSRGDAF